MSIFSKCSNQKIKLLLIDKSHRDLLANKGYPTKFLRNYVELHSLAEMVHCLDALMGKGFEKERVFVSPNEDDTSFSAVKHGESNVLLKVQLCFPYWEDKKYNGHPWIFFEGVIDDGQLFKV